MALQKIAERMPVAGSVVLIDQRWNGAELREGFLQNAGGQESTLPYDTFTSY